MAKRPPTHNQLIKQIQRLDRELVKLLSQRAELFVQAGRLQSPDDETRQTMLQNLIETNKGPLDESALRAIARELASGCQALVQQVRVAYLGPEFSYSHQAAVERFGSQAELVPVASIAAVFEEVDGGHADYGLVPIENTTDGRIVDTLDMFSRSPAKICGEVQLHIHHYLLGKCPRSEVREVHSKPQALSQCRDWLAKHLPQARCVETTSTTAAAQLAGDKEGVAAVASKQAGINYGLDVIAPCIEDNKNNITRFAVIGGEPAKKTGNDKTSLMFELSHQPGSLADSMAIFKRAKLNLTWIESFPKAGSNNEYLFFVELEGHPSQAKVKRALASLEKKTVRLEILGSYAKTQPVD